MYWTTTEVALIGTAATAIVGIGGSWINAHIAKKQREHESAENAAARSWQARADLYLHMQKYATVVSGNTAHLYQWRDCNVSMDDFVQPFDVWGSDTNDRLALHASPAIMPLVDAMMESYFAVARAAYTEWDESKPASEQRDLLEAMNENVNETFKRAGLLMAQMHAELHPTDPPKTPFEDL